MNSRQRAYLGSLANNIDPIFQIGKASLTPEIIEALDAALEKRELIKVSVLKNCIDDPKEIASVIAERTHLHVCLLFVTFRVTAVHPCVAYSHPEPHRHSWYASVSHMPQDHLCNSPLPEIYCLN